MNTLRGIIKRVLRRKGRVVRTWSMKNDVARSVNRCRRAPLPDASPCSNGWDIPLHERGIDVNNVCCFDQSGLGQWITL
jgi:hypothetical protein